MFNRLPFSATSNSPFASQPHRRGITFYEVMVGCVLALAIAGLFAL
jgi:hypothetical protein